MRAQTHIPFHLARASSSESMRLDINHSKRYSVVMDNMLSRRESFFKIDYPKRTRSLKIILIMANLFVLVLFMTYWPFWTPVSYAESTVINVPSDYSTIQAAVNVASPRDKIEVEMGEWKENIMLNKTVTLVAKEKFSTIIYAENPKRWVVTITAHNVQVIGFTIRNGSRGVAIESSNGSLLLHNKIEFNDGWGVSLNLSNSTTIEGCAISSNNWDGIYLEHSHNNTITENAIYSNHWYGVYFSASNDNFVFSNIIANNQRGGVYLEESSNDSNFMGNVVLFNDYFGIELLSSSGNTFHQNNFVDNDDQVVTTASTNHWNTTAEGNYWSDYTGEDSDGDGIGDSPYRINDENDTYPLINPWTPVRVYNATKESSTHRVTVFCNSSVTGFNFAEAFNQTSFYMLSAVDLYGFCNVTIPKQLLTGYQWLIFSNGVNITDNTIETANSTHTFLYFDFKFSSTPVWIRLVPAIDTDPPIADAGDDQTVEEDTRVIFNGSGSEDDVGIVDFSWTFIDVTTQILRGETPTYVFYTPGLYDVTLNVTDVGGNWDTDSVNILVLDITPPVADAGDNQTVNEDTTVIFNGSGSYDNVEIVNYTWTFTDTTLKSLTGIIPTYIFETPGEYFITLNVTDAARNWNTSTCIINVRDITKPTAVISHLGAKEFKKGDIITFDGSESSDNVRIVSFEWDFGDGTTSTGNTVSHAYENSGNYTVTLKVKDAAENEGTTSISVIIVEGFPWLTAAVITISVVSIAVLISALLWHRRGRTNREASELQGIKG